MRWLVCACLLLGLSRAVAGDDPAPLQFDSIGDSESIPDGVVTALAEDATGFVWIGTTAGLLRWDGYRLRRHVHQRGDPHSLGGNLVRSLTVTRDGRLWVGTDVDGLSVFDPTLGRFDVYRHQADDPASLPAGQIYAVAEDAEGRLWVGSRGGGVARLAEHGGFDHHRRAQGLPDDRVNVLLADRDGVLWVGTWSGLARHAGDGRFVPVFSSGTDSLAGQAIYALMQAEDGRLWVGTRDGGIARIDPRDGSGQWLDRADPEDAGGAGSVFAFAQPRADEIWSGRANGIGIHDAGGGQLRRLLRHDPAVPGGLAGNDVRSLLTDRAGLLWAGGFGSGLQRHDPGNRAVRVYRRQPGHGGVLDDPNIVSVLAADDGRIWLGTRGNGVAVLDASLRLVAGYPPSTDGRSGPQSGWITALAQTPDGVIWLGSRDGVHRHDPRRGDFVPLRSKQGLTSQSVRRLLVAPDGVLWIGTGDGVFRLGANGSHVERIALADGGVLGGDINALAIGDDGGLWIGGSRGLFLLRADTDAAIAVATEAGNGLAHPSVLGLLVDDRQRLWIDTGAGLHRLLDWRDGVAHFDPVAERLGIGDSDFGANLLQDATGRLWTHRYRFDPDNETLTVLTRTDGVDFGTGWFRAHAATADGRLLFGGSRGLLVIDPLQFRPWRYPAPVAVTELRIDGHVVPYSGGEVVVPGHARSVAIEFAALDFSAPERNRYRFRLHGFDRDFTDSDAGRRSASYGNLWPGRYLLEVHGSNRAGMFSETPLMVPLRVLPAWWQTPWFAALVLLSAAALVYGGVRWRLAHVQQRAMRLEQQVAARTAELRESMRRTEQALSELRGTQNQLVVAEKMASLGQLVAGIAHEINTPIGIAVTATSHLQETTREQIRRLQDGKLTRSELANWQGTVEEATRLIAGSLQRAHTLIGSFKRVAVDQSSEQRRRFDLRQFLDEVQFALQPSYRRGPHSLVITCPDGIELDTYPGAVFQILTNLVTNSLSHAFDDSVHGRMRIDVQLQGDQVRITYRDDGRGMPADVAARAFDPFFTTRRGTGGSGLGLHLVYNLATRLLGGTIELNTAPGRGSEFVLSIPRVAPLREA